MTDRFEEKAKSVLGPIGITIGGTAPGDLQVHDQALYPKVFSRGSIALGEGYMDGAWDSPDVSEFFTKLLRGNLEESLNNWSTVLVVLRAWMVNLQSPKRAYEVGKKHYDIGNDLYRAMLDKRLAYTCGYWSSPTTPAKDLDDAQEQKLDLICRKLRLQPGQTVLDIGCGWGSFLKFAAEKYGINGVGITVSQEQADLAREHCKGLPVEIRVEDYRDTKGQFDHIVSVGMFEHVGPKNYIEYMRAAHKLLKDDGLFLLHTIGWHKSVWAGEAWMEKYIFPNGVLPSIAQIGKAIEDFFIMEDWHNFGPDYDKTLMAWFANFDRAWPQLKEKYGERFYRMWKYYLMSSAGGFRARKSQLWQIVLSKQGVPHGYQSVR